MSLPTISVVVPTKNRPGEIGTLLRSLMEQPTRPLETIVVDQSTPRYRLPALDGLVHLHEPQLGGLTAARNRGVARASGEIVLFFDDDVVLENDCVAAVARYFAAHPRTVGAQCTIRNPWDDRLRGLHGLARWTFERGFFDQRPSVRGTYRVPRLIDGLASAYRRTLFEHERFDEMLTGYGLAEDWDFTKRAARHGELGIIDEARVRHDASEVNRVDVARYFEQRRRNVLYLYDKLDAGRDPRNRWWRAWWLAGERLRARRHAAR